MKSTQRINFEPASFYFSDAKMQTHERPVSQALASFSYRSLFISGVTSYKLYFLHVLIRAFSQLNCFGKLCATAEAYYVYDTPVRTCETWFRTPEISIHLVEMSHEIQIIIRWDMQRPLEMSLQWNQISSWFTQKWQDIETALNWRLEAENPHSTWKIRFLNITAKCSREKCAPRISPQTGLAY